MTAVSREYDAVVVGSGPNGLAAAIALARARRSVLVLEAAETLGGGLRSADLTLPGFVHDVCTAVVPLTLASPFLTSLPLADVGLHLIQPPIALAHPLDDGTAVVLTRSLDQTAAGLGSDGAAYAHLMGPLVASWPGLVRELLGPFRVPRHPLALLRFGLSAILPATILAHRVFRQPQAQALLAGMSAHSVLPLERPISAAVGLVLGTLGHVVGWPIVRGGTGRLAEALVTYLTSLGGEMRTGCHVDSLAEIPRHRAALLDLAPRQILRIDGVMLPGAYRKQLARYRHGPGIFKVDWALDQPIPWTADPCRRAGTLHLGGTLAEVAAAERSAWTGYPAERPFVILVQPTPFDATRAPAGKHTAWAYCHVPPGSTVDMTAAIEAQVERFAPGFRGLILARRVRNAAELEAYNANFIGGDINGGVQDLWQTWTRPAARAVPYATPNPRLFICSASTPPGGGVHGMCGYHAARAALRRLR